MLAAFLAYIKYIKLSLPLKIHTTLVYQELILNDLYSLFFRGFEIVSVIINKLSLTI